MELATGGLLNDTGRDILAVAGVILGIIPLLSSKELNSAKSASASLSEEVDAKPKRLYLLPIVVAVSLPIAVTGWLLRSSDTGTILFMLLFFLGYLFAGAVFLSVYEILKRAAFSVRIFAIVTCAICAMAAALASVAPEFPFDSMATPHISFAAAVASISFPLILGGALAVLLALLRAIYKSV